MTTCLDPPRVTSRLWDDRSRQFHQEDAAWGNTWRWCVWDRKVNRSVVDTSHRLRACGVLHSPCRFPPLSKSWLSDTVEQSVASGSADSPPRQSAKNLEYVFQRSRQTEVGVITKKDECGVKSCGSSAILFYFFALQLFRYLAGFDICSFQAQFLSAEEKTFHTFSFSLILRTVWIGCVCLYSRCPPRFVFSLSSRQAAIHASVFMIMAQRCSERPPLCSEWAAFTLLAPYWKRSELIKKGLLTSRMEAWETPQRRPFVQKEKKTAPTVLLACPALLWVASVAVCEETLHLCSAFVRLRAWWVILPVRSFHQLVT